ncbi:hypothetical protein MMC24_007408 [Lignoscripta atroalba]|nr:hypothetical protein [Lignoscripta atroalba]
MEDDLFDSLLGLEDKFYDEGYQLGMTEGTRAGHIEGRVFGLEKGFEKFISMGKLHGRSVIWAGRLPQSRKDHSRQHLLESKNVGNGCTKIDSALISRAEHAPEQNITKEKESHQGTDASPHQVVPLLSDSSRLEKHIRTFHALVEPESLSTQNNEDAVSDFDDRLKRAQGKAKIIEKLIGEETEDSSFLHSRLDNSRSALPVTKGSSGDGSIEDISSLNARH